MVFSEADVVDRMQKAENYGYWLAIKHVVLGLVMALAAFVAWNIPASTVTTINGVIDQFADYPVDGFVRVEVPTDPKALESIYSAYHK